MEDRGQTDRAYTVLVNSNHRNLDMAYDVRVNLAFYSPIFGLL